MIETIKVLTARSATIQQLNAVRTYLCKVKGGGLARYISPATIVSLIISDVIGDPLHYIASGPTFPTEVSADHVTRTLAELSLTPVQLPVSVQEILHSGHSSSVTCGSDIYNLIIASNKVALEIAAHEVESEGYKPYIVSDTLSGEARDVAVELINSVTASEDQQYNYITPEMSRNISSALSCEDGGKKCLIFGERLQ